MKITVKYPRWGYPSVAKEVSFDMEILVRNDRTFLKAMFAGFGNHPYPESEPLLMELSKICRKAQMRSLSVGDFVQIGDVWYQCAALGWITVDEAKVNRVMKLSQYDTWSDKDLHPQIESLEKKG